MELFKLNAQMLFFLCIFGRKLSLKMGEFKKFIPEKSCPSHTKKIFFQAARKSRFPPQKILLFWLPKRRLPPPPEHGGLFGGFQKLRLSPTDKIYFGGGFHKINSPTTENVCLLPKITLTALNMSDFFKLPEIRFFLLAKIIVSNPHKRKTLHRGLPKITLASPENVYFFWLPKFYSRKILPLPHKKYFL